jgi:hypothetical protein
VEAMGLEPTNLLTASQALYQLSYAPEARHHVSSPTEGLGRLRRPRQAAHQGESTSDERRVPGKAAPVSVASRLPHVRGATAGETT